MSTIRVVLADDEVYALRNLEFELEQFSEVEIVGKTTRAIEVIGLVRELHPDLIFLDVNMPQMNGLQVIDELQALGICPPVVLVTAHSDYTLEAYERFVFNYLLKPIDSVQLTKIINRFCMNVSNEEVVTTKQKIKFPCKSGLKFFCPDDIMAFKAAGNYTSIYLNSGKEEVVVVQLGKLASSVEHATFFKTNRSCIINLDFMSYIDRNNMEVHLTAGEVNCQMPISRERLRVLEDGF